MSSYKSKKRDGKSKMYDGKRPISPYDDVVYRDYNCLIYIDYLGNVKSIFTDQGKFMTWEQLDKSTKQELIDDGYVDRNKYSAG